MCGDSGYVCVLRQSDRQAHRLVESNDTRESEWNGQIIKKKNERGRGGGTEKKKNRKSPWVGFEGFHITIVVVPLAGVMAKTQGEIQSHAINNWEITRGGPSQSSVVIPENCTCLCK